MSKRFDRRQSRKFESSAIVQHRTLLIDRDSLDARTLRACTAQSVLQTLYYRLCRYSMVLSSFIALYKEITDLSKSETFRRKGLLSEFIRRKIEQLRN